MSESSDSNEFDPYKLAESLRDGGLGCGHLEFPAIYRPNGTVPKPNSLKVNSPSHTLTEIAPIRNPEKRGKSCRLVKARHLIRINGGNDIQPGQMCVAVETAGTGKGKLYDGIHAVRVRLPESNVRRLTVARVDIIGNTLMWDDREDVDLSNVEYEIVGNVIGCYASDRRTAPILTMMSN